MMRTLVLILAFSTLTAADAWARPDFWAVPVAEAKVGNFFEVDEGVYRSKQPSKRGMAHAYDLGVREVLNLRGLFDDEDEAAGLALTLHQIDTAAARMDDSQLLAALEIIESRDGPILVHCWQGADRTGAVIAAYRVVVQNWSKDQAIAEMIHGGYGFHRSWYQNLVALIRELDVEAYQRQLGLLPELERPRGEVLARNP